MSSPDIENVSKSHLQFVQQKDNGETGLTMQQRWSPAGTDSGAASAIFFFWCALRLTATRALQVASEQLSFFDLPTTEFKDHSNCPIRIPAHRENNGNEFHNLSSALILIQKKHSSCKSMPFLPPYTLRRWASREQYTKR